MNRGIVGYVYENSNPDRFQQLCQSLLISDHPNLQCLPFGQPDGGRDGWDPGTHTVLQVKFKRSDEIESADWVINALKGELKKIEQLIARGAENYIIATNARGTAHLDVGRIDKVQAWLDRNVSIPARCYWRDEIDRRLDLAPTTLKLKYSEMLTLEDGIDVVLAQAFGPSHQRQQSAIRAFVAWQYNTDEKVKFKQVSLSNDLLDLFIDVPVGFPRSILDDQRKTSTGSNFPEFIKSFCGGNQALVYLPEAPDEDVRVHVMSDPQRPMDIGAGELLLSAAAQEHLKLIVLEGAPGQGKSTLAQYICQLHRARYLNKVDLFKRVPERYKQTAFRIPIKVDLRDLAGFLEGHSPFDDAAAPSSGAVRSLEVFLGQLVTYKSGGIEFNVSDVLTLFKNSPILLFLDGLDEVADIEHRERLVISVMESLNRLGESQTDVQVVVTSRPSVFGKGPNLGRFGFLTLTLNNIDRHRIEEYAEKWVTARGLEPIEQRDVKKILAEKLELAHIRELTRNPMQLTILLSLIHQIGHSLPDQRTDLYRRYVDLFLTREADKSVHVRDHRPLLIGFIQHLAWVLQSQAESSRSSGSISAVELQEMARKYLEEGSHSVALADDLFSGGLERIFVLVERIEGLYEFEVQPLREYFCARHLYETAPVGTYRDAVPHGDRAQRFEAIAANPFWLNVSRFYAGSYASGEIGTLVLSLEEMIKTKDMPGALHVRRVGVALLKDWVFSNKKFAQEKLVRIIFDDVGIESLVAADRGINEEIRLALECGQDLLRSILFEQIKRTPIDVRPSVYCRALRQNGGRQLSDQFCQLLHGTEGRERTKPINADVPKRCGS